MSRSTLLRLVTKVATPARPNRVGPQSSLVATTRSIATSNTRRNNKDRYHGSSTAATGTSAGPHEGSASRTDSQIVVEYPEARDFPREPAVQGRGG
jgi:hypothetical protein